MPQLSQEEMIEAIERWLAATLRLLETENRSPHLIHRAHAHASHFLRSIQQDVNNDKNKNEE